MGVVDAVQRLFRIDGNEYRCGYCHRTFTYPSSLADLPDLNCPYCDSLDIERVSSNSDRMEQ